MKKLTILFVGIVFLLHTHSALALKDSNGTNEMIPWTKVNQLLPRYSKFTVEDLETGKKFRVQRRAGSHHADVQPLTAKDTKIMKEIYGGKWSWKRRAIIVINKKQRIAASMHGMPHGAGALKNNFPGHFCIHFDGSTTHRTNAMDLSHKLMILKASSKLDDYLAKAGPYDVVNAYVAALKQQDSKIASLISLQKINWKSILPEIENVKIARMPMLPSEDITDEISMDIPIEIDWYIKDKGRQVSKGEVHLVRFSPLEPWLIDSKDFLKENKLQ